MVEIRNLIKFFKPETPVFSRPIELKIPDHSVFLIKGANGSGKTTLLKLISLQLIADQGDIVFDQKKIEFYDSIIRKNFGWCSSDFTGLFQNLTLQQNLDFFGQLYELDKKTVNEQINNLAPELGLKNSCDTSVQNLSTGFKRRSTILKSILHTPKYLFLDEPFNSLDTKSIQEISSFLKNWSQKNKTTILIASHIPAPIDFATHEFNL